MFSNRLIVSLSTVTLFTCIQADFARISSTSTHAFYANVSSTPSRSSFSYETPSVCCFVIQETATENYWPIESVTSWIYNIQVVEVTSFITPFKNGTVTNVVSRTTKEETTSYRTLDFDVNPITFDDNPVPPLPTQESYEMAPNVTAVTIGEVTINSPAAFLIFSTLKIITVDPVTNTDGFVQCGTRSSWDAPGSNPRILPTWPNINSNAEAYFGGYGLAGDNQEPTSTAEIITTGTSEGNLYTGTSTQNLNGTFYTNSAGQTIEPQVVSTGMVTEIVLETPFAYLPAKGKAGATNATSCWQSDETEMYGYVPQTLVDQIAQDRQYVAQYPDLASCLPGGPSMLRRETCFQHSSNFSFVVQTPEGGDLSRTTVITVTPPAQITAQSVVDTTRSGGNHIVGTPDSGPPTMPTGVSATQPELAQESSNFNSEADGGDPPLTRTSSQNSGQLEFITLATTDGIQRPPPATSLGAIINSIAGGDPAAQQQNGGPNEGSITAITPPAGGQPIPIILGSTTFISGTPVFMIPAATTVPAAGLPTGLGSTTIINGTPFLVIQPTTLPLPLPPTQQTFPTTTINGTPFLLIPGPTTIPVAGAPSGLIGSTTIISGTPFLVIPASTSVPALSGHITVIDGTTFDIFTGQTTVAVHSELPLVGVTTVVNGTTMVVLPGPTTIAVKPGISSSGFVQASGAGRGRGSLVGFVWELMRGFVLRFR